MQISKQLLPQNHLMLQPRTNTRRLAIATALLVILMIAVMVRFALPSLPKPLVMDEMEFPAVAKAITETGKPIYYRGETNSHNVGLWHPPLYIVAYAIWQSFFGYSIISDRAFGLFNACLALVLIGIFVVRRWSEKVDNDIGAIPKLIALALGLCIAITSPLLIQGSTLPDIDTQLLCLTITAFFLLIFELRRCMTSGINYWIIFVVVMTIQLFAKLTTPILLIPAIIIFELLRSSHLSGIAFRIRFSQRSVKANPSLRSWTGSWVRVFTPVVVTIAAGLASLVLFIITWYLIASVWGVDFQVPFKYLTISTTNPANSGGTFVSIVAAILQELPSHLIYLIQWVGIPTLAFLLLMIVREFFKPQDGILSRAERSAIYTFSLLLMIMYLILRPNPFDFPKYHPPVILPLSLLAIDLLFALSKAHKIAFTVAILGAEFIAYVVYIMITQPAAQRDFIYQIYYNPQRSSFFAAWMITPLLIVTIINGFIWLLSQRRIGELFLVGTLAVTFGWQVTESIEQAGATYATTYYYGEMSLVQVTDYLRSTMPEQAIIIAPKDVGARLTDHWRYIELGVDPRPDFGTPGVNYLVFRSNDYYGHTLQDTPEIAAAVQDQFEVVATIDNFTIMQRSKLAKNP